MSTRDNDLKELQADMNNMSLPYTDRKLAYQAFCNVQRQLKDRVLQELRERLVKATQARDHKEMRKLNEQLLERKYRMHYGK